MDDELPRDPDLDAVPMAAEALDGKVVVHIGPDGVAERVGVMCVTPSVVADFARRAPRERGDPEA